ncbi:MAG: LacI family DNA-binding transcriptional regulator [Acidimicrobiales bacterium]
MGSKQVGADGSGGQARGQPGGRRPTLADVAKVAGVSASSVSYALNGLPGVSERKRRHILAVARKLGFRPNRLASALRRGETKMLGLLLVDIANPFYPELASAVVTEAAAHGYEVFLSHTGLHDELKQSAIRALLDRQCDGLLFTSVVQDDAGLLSGLVDDRVPFVQVVRQVDGLAADFVGIDDRAAGRDIARHLFAGGRRHPAILGGPQASSASRARLLGYLDACAEHRVQVRHRDLAEGELTHESGYSRTEELLARTDGPRPDALICGNDMIALGALDALLAKGFTIPDDMAVVGYDDMSFAGSELVGLTSVNVPRDEIGRQAVRALLHRINNMDGLAQKVILPHRVVVRRTCGAATQ